MARRWKSRLRSICLSHFFRLRVAPVAWGSTFAGEFVRAMVLPLSTTAAKNVRLESRWPETSFFSFCEPTRQRLAPPRPMPGVQWHHDFKYPDTQFSDPGR